HPKFLAGFSAVAICGYCTAAVIGVDEFGPTFTGDRIDLPAGKFEPRLVYPSAIPRFIGLPDKDRRGIGDVSKTRFAFADLGVGALPCNTERQLSGDGEGKADLGFGELVGFIEIDHELTDESAVRDEGDEA